MDDLYYIVDLRPEWRRKPYITFWRPDNAGYAFPLPWAGKYSSLTVENGGGYYTNRDGRRWVRFAVPCGVVDAMGVLPKANEIDGDVGPVVTATAQNRRALIAARLRLPRTTSE